MPSKKLLEKNNSSLKTKIENGKLLVWDGIRKKYVVFTPEENVRQQFISFLINEKHFPNSLIAVERGLNLNGLQKRFDILVFDKSGNPLLLVECKAPEVKITDAVFEQISNYNLHFKVPYLMVTNGHEMYCCQINFIEKKYSFLNPIPNYEQLI